MVKEFSDDFGLQSVIAHNERKTAKLIQAMPLLTVKNI